MPATPVSAGASRTVAADPSTVYALVADVTRMGEWSPETVSAEWLDGATAAVAGARFAGRNELGSLRWTTKPVVLEAESGRRFAFKVPGRAGATWTYELEAVPGGTRITETVSQDKPSPLPIRLLQRRAGVTDRSASLQAGIETTLARLAAAAEHRAVAA